MQKILYYMFTKKRNILNVVMLYALLFVSILLTNYANSYSPLLMSDGNPFIYYPLIIITLILSVLPLGLCSNCLSALINNENELPLPNLKSIVKDGGKLLVALLVLGVLVFVVFGFLGFINGFLAKHALVIFSFLVSIIAFFMLFIIFFNLIVSSAIFINTKNIFSFVNFKSSYFELNKIRTGHYTIYSIVFGIIIFITYFLKTFLLLSLYFSGIPGLIIYTIIVSAIWTYVIFVLLYLFAIAINTTKTENLPTK